MFSRFHHRRGPSTSTPTSPVPPAIDGSTAWEPAALHEKHASVAQRPVSSSSNTSNLPPAATSSTAPRETVVSTASTAAPPSSLPHSLPPISRMSVMTVPSDVKYDLAKGNSKATDSSQSRSSYSAPSSSLDTRRPSSQQPARMTSPQQTHDSPQAHSNEPTFIGGLALANLRRSGTQDLSAAAAAAAATAATAAKRPTSLTYPASATSPTPAATASPSTYSTSERRMSRQKPPPPPINTSLTPRQHLSPAVGGGQGKDGRPGSRSASSFVTPTDLQSSAAAAAAASAVNAANDMYHNNSNAAAAASHVNSSAATAAVAANARTKKSRPFLKNPVSSLLGRRKTTASTPDMASLAGFSNDSDVPVYAPIRGTRVHDFSAPRQPRIVTNEPPASASASTAAVAAAAAVANSTGFIKATASTRQPVVPSPNPSLRPRSSDTADGTSRKPQVGPSDDGSAALSQAVQQTTSSPYPASTDPSVTPDDAQSYVAPFPKPSTADLRGTPMRTLSQGALQTLQENDTISFDETPLAERCSTDGLPRPIDTVSEGPEQGAVPDQEHISVRALSTRSRVASADVSSILKSSPSTATTRSRNVSISEVSPNSNAGGQSYTSATTPGSAVSALPKHMKSTSSRFSFMMGSSEEKVLEERHRQKQAEMKATGADARDTRDSRYYDSDEEDFDYDAMMDDDDGFEERIPGVNADFEEDDYHLYGDDDTPHVGLGDQDFLNQAPNAAVEATGAPMDDDDDAYKSEYEDAVADPIPEAKPAVQVKVEIEDDDPDGLDPNNDQENFAGFVFQRSNPASSLVSPTSAGILATPRDATGRVIGFAMTKDTTPDLNPPSAKSLSPMNPNLLNAAMESHRSSLSLAENADVGGLGIQHMLIQGAPGNEAYDDYSATENLDDYEAESDYDEPTVTLQHVQDPFQQYAEQLAELDQPVPIPAQQLEPRRDDLYFDQGLADELDFGAPDNSAPFDENLFDLPDTDQYGRPLPGVFAAAQAAQAAQRNAMAAAVEAAASGVKRESEAPSSGLSDQSQLAEESTAHTSTSISQFAQARKPEDSLTSLRRQLPPILTDAERVVAYQAALSEAAFKAAAQGKFRRDSESAASDYLSGRASPPPTGSPPVNEQNILLETAVGLGLSFGAGESAIEASTSPMAPVAASGIPDASSADTASQSHLAYAFTSQRDLDYQQNFEEDDYLEDMDDYDFDDAIIAEANAEALANDMDGFYGQEFNFYSAPTNQGPTAKETIQYAHGGYFIPEGIGRSISGRVVSREPILTPITERSEYSNRNSVMSLAVPPYGSSSELRSPGLAQLALLADDNDMSLSALLRLRTKTFGGAGSQASSREGSPMLIPPGGMSIPGSAPASASVSALGFDRDRGDRENASSPYDQRLTPAQLQLLQKQYPLPPSHYHTHHRMNSGASQLSRGAGSSDYNNSEGGSDCGSPTLTNLQAINNISGTIPPVPPIPQSLPISPIPAGMVNSVTSSCTPVLEEEGESAVVNILGGALSREPTSATSDLLPVTAPSGRSSASGSGLWMRSPVTGSLNAKHHRQNSSSSEQQIHDLQFQLQLEQREKELMHQKILALEQKNENLEQTILAASPMNSQSPTNSMPPPPIPPISTSRGTSKGHRHKGSAESVSYVMAGPDDAGQSQWVVEHRRTGETGQVEILKREYVDYI
ncbi:hypothetical protein F503_07155 [Ophiostoma piceae UAMH 11346]|uniref:Uncharacterized protein n=1 Tax=Ophiostoma piceae (strain UAMH 11346) TaxID=1262450 RepID=S3C758_OPHP1|nr:hypothetical protein F503_07155 [Ophiostoma piceae UAMH 11346]